MRIGKLLSGLALEDQSDSAHHSDQSNSDHGDLRSDITHVGLVILPLFNYDLGCATVSTGVSSFAVLAICRLDSDLTAVPVVLFLDELNRARPEVLQTIMDLTLNRKLAGKALPLGSRIISAVNNGNEYQLTDLDPALVSRFNIYEFAPTVDDWIKWAENTGIDGRIISFIEENPEYLDGEISYVEASNLERTPDRRSWERASKILVNFQELSDVHKPIFTGIIGNQATAMLFRYIKEHNVPSAKEILTGNFENIQVALKTLSVPDFTTVNNSLFRFIEAGRFEGNENSVISENLVKYFKFLTADVSKEEQLDLHVQGLTHLASHPICERTIHE